MLFATLVSSVSLVCAASITARQTDTTTASSTSSRPFFEVPGLTEVRTILALLEAPIITAIVQRASLPVDSSLYSNKGAELLDFIKVQEALGQVSNRYAYGALEYPFTLAQIAPDHVTNSNPFPPGRFHQDTFTSNSNLTNFYLNDLLPLLSSANQIIGSTSVFFHLTNGTSTSPVDTVSKYSLDYQLLALLAHRSSIGKVVAEAKYLGAPSTFAPLITSQNATGIQALVTNLAQVNTVLTQAATDSFNIATEWEAAQGADSATAAAFVASIQNAVAVTYNNLIDITTEVEIEYLLQRFN